MAVAGRSAAVLVVAGEEAVREQARQALQTAGYPVMVCPGGAEAVKLSLQRAGRIDLLLCDMSMPRMSGPELYDQLMLSRPDLKVAFMTSSGGSIMQKALEQSFTFIHTPFTDEELLQGVREALDSPTVY